VINIDFVTALKEKRYAEARKKKLLSFADAIHRRAHGGPCAMDK